MSRAAPDVSRTSQTDGLGAPLKRLHTQEMAAGVGFGRRPFGAFGTACKNHAPQIEGVLIK
jgi:hypothetical protein